MTYGNRLTQPLDNSMGPVLNPYGIESLHAELRFLSGVGGGLIVSSVVLSVISLGLRWRVLQESSVSSSSGLPMQA
jgi:hypothetical protein